MGLETSHQRPARRQALRGRFPLLTPLQGGVTNWVETTTRVVRAQIPATGPRRSLLRRSRALPTGRPSHWVDRVPLFGPQALAAGYSPAAQPIAGSSRIPPASWVPLERRARLQEDGYDNVYIDATYLKGRLGKASQVCSRAVVVAMGVNGDGLPAFCVRPGRRQRHPGPLG